MSEPEIRITWKGRLVALLIGAVFLAGASELIARIVYPSWSEFFAGRFLTVEHVPEHGDVAVGRKGFDGYFSQNNGDFRVHIKINEAGLRDDEPVKAADGRVWIIGDSMAFGWGVERDEMYSSVIADRLGRPTYNVASPGTNVCGYQALTGRMPDSIKPSAVVVGLILENDLQVYDCDAYAKQERAPADASFRFASLKPVLTEHSALYNFFAVALKRVDVFREALIWVGAIKRSHAYRNLLEGEDIDMVTDSTARALVRLREMFDPATPFVVLVAPARFEIANDDPAFREIRRAMNQALANHGLAYVDPIDGFKQAGFAGTHLVHDGHWSAAGHEIAGTAVTEWLKRNLPQ